MTGRTMTRAITTTTTTVLAVRCDVRAAFFVTSPRRDEPFNTQTIADPIAEVSATDLSSLLLRISSVHSGTWCGSFTFSSFSSYLFLIVFSLTVSYIQLLR